MTENGGHRRVVMIPGAGDNHRVWSGVGGHVTAGGFEWIGIDLPGRNEQTDEHPGSVEGLADWVVAYMTREGLRDVVLVGHSMGSIIALEVAARAPALVSRLVLLCTGTPMVVSDALLAPESPEALHARITKWSHAPDAGDRYADAIEQHVAEFASLREDTFVLDLRSCHEYRGAVDAAAKVGVPTTVVVAELDVMVPERLTAPIVEALSECRVVTIPGVGHALSYEAPGETAAIIIEAATSPLPGFPL